MKTNALFTCIICCSLIACKNETKSIGTATPTPIVTSPAATSAAATSKSEVALYTAVMNDLRVREQGNMTANVIEKVKFGEVVIGTGDISAHKDSAMINEMPYKEPWYAIKTPNGKSGWVFGGGIQAIYKGEAKDAPDGTLLTKFYNHLNTLNIKDVNSGKKGIDFVTQNFQTANAATYDAACEAYFDFLWKMQFEEVYKMTEKVKFSDKDMENIWKDKYDMSKNPNMKLLADNGFRLETTEGSVLPIADWEFVKKHFYTHVSTPMQNYITQTLKEQKEPLSSDNGVVIPAKEVVDRAVFWEKFVTASPNFFLTKNINEHAKAFCSILIAGMDNTPTFSHEKNTLAPEIQQAYDYLLKEHPTTQAAKTIGSFYDLVKAEGMKKTPKVETAMNRAWQ
jgi:hypothetical protein